MATYLSIIHLYGYISYNYPVKCDKYISHKADVTLNNNISFVMVQTLNLNFIIMTYVFRSVTFYVCPNNKVNLSYFQIL